MMFFIMNRFRFNFRRELVGEARYFIIPICRWLVPDRRLPLASQAILGRLGQRH